MAIVGRAWRVAAAAAVLIGMTTVASEAASAQQYPENWNVLSAFAGGVWEPGTPPAGANVSSCQLTSTHPNPVVLVHGTFENQNDNWQAIAPFLANDGFCVYTFTYGQTWYSGGIGGVGDIYSSAKQLGSFVQRVLTQTGAGQVDLVGHSQGGMLPRVYLKDGGGVPFVHQIVGLAADNYIPGVSGVTELAELIPGAQAVLDFGCPSCSEQTSQSFFNQLNSGTVTYPTVQYSEIESTHDEVVTPYQHAFLPAAPNVTDETVQQYCPDDPVGHIGIVYDSDVAQMVANALAPALAQPVLCSSGFGY
jgi:triacylglycerol esterase/lipase EstA (alpha/beta hydrolase family)